MWILTDVVDAKPVMVFGVASAGITCFKSKPTKEFAAIEVAGTITTPSMAIVAVAADAEVFANTMLVTTVVVDELGTV